MALKKGKPLVDWTKPAPGRPKSNLSKYAVKPVGPDRSKTGFEMLNNTPEAIKGAEEHYLKKGRLPPAWMPTFEPEVMARQRAKQISKGWIKPRSPAG